MTHPRPTNTITIHPVTDTDPYSSEYQYSLPVVGTKTTTPRRGPKQVPHNWLELERPEVEEEEESCFDDERHDVLTKTGSVAVFVSHASNQNTCSLFFDSLRRLLVGATFDKNNRLLVDSVDKKINQPSTTTASSVSTASTSAITSTEQESLPKNDPPPHWHYQEYLAHPS